MVFARRKGQGAFEYILMLSGVLLIVILIILILRGTLSGANNQVAASQNQFGNVTQINMVSDSTPNLYVSANTGGVTGTVPCCSRQTVFGTTVCTGARGLTSTTGCTPNPPNRVNCPSRHFDNSTGLCV